ncbi:hypothetical protein [Streptomyces sp. 35G-GA-8]|uniref:hypothetical protein n=1 Tax=Streptomyces sp. 35G-GA-8 TaxID=2939434 RepID=UPI00201F0E78|nr:hypothetical protein [Streptomyces sp. 35G-GA-8]MCL7377439.1 hypothetical protein [Streptomyces sp. 35G-GA-8]
MGMYHSTYFAYGFQIPQTDPDRLEDLELGYLLAGDYDRDMVFLVTQCVEVRLGTYKTVRPHDATQGQYEDWDEQLRAAAETLAVTPITEPGWIVVPDLS